LRFQRGEDFEAGHAGHFEVEEDEDREWTLGAVEVGGAP
jgi:hypothetical protein